MSWTLNMFHITFSSGAVFRILCQWSQHGINCLSVRDLTLKSLSTPHTMQKALSELERSVLRLIKQTSGEFIAEDTEMLTQMKKELATEHIQEFFSVYGATQLFRAVLHTQATKAAEGEN